MTRTAKEIREESHRREVARRGLTRYFSDIAETAARRAAAASAEGENVNRETAKERLAALRRRILERTEAAGASSSGLTVRSTEANSEEASLVFAAPASNEDDKMHLSHEEISLGEADGGPAEGVPRATVRDAAANVVPIAGAVAAAASRVAWYTAAGQPGASP